jgi:hypothetical protein
VLAQQNDRIVVLFEQVGYKTLSVPAVLAGGVLALAAA